MDLNENVLDEELINTTSWRVEHLLSLNGEFEGSKFKQVYKQYYDTDYVCPLRQKHNWLKCLRQHFKQVKISSVNGQKFISWETEANGHVGKWASGKNELTVVQSDKFPSPAEAAKLHQAPKHKKIAFGPSTKSAPVHIDKFLNGTAITPQARQTEGAVSATPKANGRHKEV